MSKTGYINGSDLLLKVAGKYVGHSTTHTTTYTSETKDRAVKPVGTAAIASGKFKGKSVTGMSISISAEGIRNFSETEGGFKTLYDAWKKGESVEVECLERGSETPYLEGNFVITSLVETAPAEDDATYSINLENDGAPTSFDTTGLTGETVTTTPS